MPGPMPNPVTPARSDWMLGNAMIRPHALQFPNPRIQLMTSLDHAMWFHAPFKADEWMLCVACGVIAAQHCS